MPESPFANPVSCPDLHVLAATESLCPQCLRRIEAWRVTDGRDVFLYKECPGHGRFQTIVWRGVAGYEQWVRPKIPTRPPVCSTLVGDGCPFDCGLCPDHRQRTCTVLVEVTGRCNLRCPVCFADAGDAATTDPPLEAINAWYRRVKSDAGICNVQISGGEPTVREDLPAIIEGGRRAGFEFLQLNTNGLRLGADRGYVKRLKDAGLSSVFLQFDGLDDQVYQGLRGRPLVDRKFKAIEHCAAHGIGVVLVPTVVPGVNIDQVGGILDLAVRSMPAVRGVHFQPISYFGRFPGIPTDEDRLTLPDLLNAVEEQTQGRMRANHFSPPGCENALCSFHGKFMLSADNMLRHLVDHSGRSCCPEPAEEGALRTIASVARQWKAPDCAGMEVEAAECGCSPERVRAVPGLRQLDEFLSRASTHTLSVSAMAFQDVWNIDLERVRDCCIHVAFPDGRLIPFCARNLTGSTGQPLYDR